MIDLSRRQLLAAGTSAAALAGLSPRLIAAPSDVPIAVPRTPVMMAQPLLATRRTIDIAGRAAEIYGLVGPGGRPGLTLGPKQPFQVELRNDLGDGTLIHWHGQTPPSAQDGVPELSQPLLKPSEAFLYDFPTRPGSHWMHSHNGFQEMQLLAAPLIVRSAEDVAADRQEVVMFLQDYTFRAPEEVLAGLVGGGHGGHAGHGGAGGGHQGHGGGPGIAARFMAWLRGGHAQHQQAAATIPMPAMQHALNDVDFDAYLANDRTLIDPDVVRVEKGGRVRLRVINGSTGTVFHIDTGEIEGELVAVDGNPVEPVRGRRFGLAMAQRIDILVSLPAGTGAWPVLACREGDRVRTGLILATADGEITKIPEQGENIMPAFGVELERQLRATQPLPQRTIDRRLQLSLTGQMANYVWSIDGQVWGKHKPVMVRKDERVEIVMRNMTAMAHPMHLHGHHFQVTAIGREAVDGAVRDTIHIPPMSDVTVVFDADNPGRWAMHCHNLLHMAAGMMTELTYET